MGADVITSLMCHRYTPQRRLETLASKLKGGQRHSHQLSRGGRDIRTTEIVTTHLLYDGNRYDAPLIRLKEALAVRATNSRFALKETSALLSAELTLFYSSFRSFPLSWRCFALPLEAFRWVDVVLPRISVVWRWTSDVFSEHTLISSSPVASWRSRVANYQLIT